MRSIGPFERRAQAEAAAIALAADPRAYGTIRIVVEEVEDDEREEARTS
jgi:hypothetical protein